MQSKEVRKWQDEEALKRYQMIAPPLDENLLYGTWHQCVHKQEIYANLTLYDFGIFLANEAAKENDKKKRKKTNKYQYSVDISTALKLARKYLIRKENNKKFDIISLIAKHVHAVKTEFRQFDRPLRGIGAIHFGYR